MKVILEFRDEESRRVIVHRNVESVRTEPDDTGPDKTVVSQRRGPLGTITRVEDDFYAVSCTVANCVLCERHNIRTDTEAWENAHRDRWPVEEG